MLLGVVSVNRVLRLLERLFDEAEFLSPYGLRAISRWHAEHPFELDVDGTSARVDYEPAESTTGMFGGNSNWRGPVWMPVNFLLVEALGRYARFFEDELRVEYPTGSGVESTLEEVAADLRERLMRSSPSVPTAAARASAGSSACRRTRRGRTTCSSTSTSTATTAPVSARATRQGGRASSRS